MLAWFISLAKIKHYQCCHLRRSYPTPPHHHSHLTSCSAPRLTTAGRCCWWCCCAWPSFESSRRTPVVGATLRKCVIESFNTQHILVWSSNVFPSIFVSQAARPGALQPNPKMKAGNMEIRSLGCNLGKGVDVLARVGTLAKILRSVNQ